MTVDRLRCVSEGERGGEAFLSDFTFSLLALCVSLLFGWCTRLVYPRLFYGAPLFSWACEKEVDRVVRQGRLLLSPLFPSFLSLSLSLFASHSLEQTECREAGTVRLPFLSRPSELALTLPLSGQLRLVQLQVELLRSLL